MIVEIHQSGTVMRHTLRYNEDKVLKGVASVLCTANMGGTRLHDINAVFEIREKMAIRDLAHVSFQMSVNPGTEDAITEREIPDFVADVMKGMGYGNQPWVVFRHNDISRTHYHVVSIRVDENGRKIRDYFEKRNCDRIVLSLESKYGYTKGVPEKPASEELVRMPIFEHGDDNIVRSMERCIEHSMSYRFTTERQFAEVLRCHGVSVQEGLGRRQLKVHLSFQGLDDDGRPCTASISDSRLSFDVRQLLLDRIGECVETDRRKERMEVRHELAQALDSCDSLTDIVRQLRRRHIDMVIYRDRQNVPRGMTLIDHKSRCVFKASELSRSLSARLLAADGGGSPFHSGDGDIDDGKRQEPRDGIKETLRDCLLCALLENIPQGRQMQDYRPKRRRRKR